MTFTDTFVSCSENVPINWKSDRFVGSTPQVPSLLAAAKDIAGSDVDLVTIDMPIATVPFSSRRSADDAISTAFGRFGCAAHSPSSERPGRLSTDIMTQLNYAGYPLATTVHNSGTFRRTIEVYPHPALLRLLNCQYRVPYKFAKSLRYWPDLDIRDRICRILDEFKGIERALSDTFGYTRLIIPDDSDLSNLAQLKRYEDSIDSLICAWVGVQYANRTTKPYGDHTAAIWIPEEHESL